jgi:hypothetical protein
MESDVIGMPLHAAYLIHHILALLIKRKARIPGISKSQLNAHLSYGDVGSRTSCIGALTESSQ